MDTKKFKEAFKRADSNGDGQIDLDEFIEHYKSQGVNISREDAYQIFKDKDKDLDGIISFDEFAGKLTESEKAWKALDANRNGYVTKDELVEGIRKYKKSLPKIITDGNIFTTLLDQKLKSRKEDRINYEDFCSLMKEAKKDKVVTSLRYV